MLQNFHTNGYTQEVNIFLEACMSGSVFFMKDRLQWAVGFRWQGKKYNITRYKGQLMKQIHPNKRKDINF